MEIFGIGLPELLLILVLALIVFGPERLPKIARDLGSTLASFRREAEGIRQEFIASMEDVGGPVQDSIQELRSALNIPTRPAPFALPDAGEAASSPSGYSAAANPSAVTTAPTLPSASAPVMPAAKATPTTISAAPVDETAINTRAPAIYCQAQARRASQAAATAGTRRRSCHACAASHHRAKRNATVDPGNARATTICVGSSQ